MGTNNPFIKDGKLYGQDFDDIKSSCMRGGALFQDDHFPPVARSLYYSRDPSGVASYVTWLRPSEICEEPELFVDGADRHDINQGELGDCWLLAAISSLTIDKNKLDKVLPEGQSFQAGYTGIFMFRFWQYGEWVEVVVDDYLPCKNGKLIFIHSDSKNEFWSALLEKAYAKLHGSYENLLGGKSSDAMVDFTGGCPESYSLERSAVPEKLFPIMLKSYQRKSMMCCSITSDPYKFEAKTPMGLVMGHAYTVTKVIRLSNGEEFVRVRNPWGNEQEWKGKWADGSKEWESLSSEERKRFGLTFDSDGEWWMEFEDFLRNFNELEMCHLCPEKMLGIEEKVSLDIKKWHGKWLEGVSAGGCRNFLSTFVKNPQYAVTLRDVDEDDGDNLCTLMVSLMQKGRRSLKDEGENDLSIGFVIYKLNNKEQSKSHLGEEFFKYTAHSALSDNFVNAREVTGRFKLSPGTYIIVPSTYQPDSEGEFLLRAFREKLRAEKNIQHETSNHKDESVNIIDNKKIVSNGKEEHKERKSKQRSKHETISHEQISEPDVTDGKVKAVDKSSKQEKGHTNEVSKKRAAIHHFKYEHEEDDPWACITSPGTTTITISTPGTRIMTITIMDHVKKDF